jgi:anti-anti-sigma factor
VVDQGFTQFWVAVLPDSVDPSSTVVRLSGEFDITTVPSLRSALDLAYEFGQRIVVDMSDVDFVDAAAISLLVAAGSGAREYGSQLVVRNPSPFVSRVLAMASLDGQLLIEG